MNKIGIVAAGLAFGFAAPLSALDCEGASSQEEILSSELTTLICEDEGLLEAHQSLEKLGERWLAGPNGEELQFFQGTPPEWYQDLSECDTASDLRACAESFYARSSSQYSETALTKTSKDEEGILYQGLVAMGPSTRAEIYIDERLVSDGRAEHELLTYQNDLTASLNGDLPTPECLECFRQDYLQIAQGFQDPVLTVALVNSWRYEGGAHPTSSYQTVYYDTELVEPIGFTGLFEEAKWEGVRDEIITHIESNLDSLEISRQQMDNDTNVVHFPDVTTRLKQLPKEDWDQMAFIPDLAGGKIIGFRLQADDYEFAPHAYSDFYTDLIIPMSMGMSEGLKEEYRSSFSLL